MLKIGKLVLAAVGAIWIVGSVNASARTVSVSSFDGVTGAVTLTLSTGDPALIYAVGDKEDKGVSFDSWMERDELSRISNCGAGVLFG